ncbi:MAG: hypothetical protein DRH33_08760 [Candidatus Nealsonbacteria bacterium]|nr:MAG: hypothetical protein DRH33_08760 [Candidatus Nealsonbacteria bacterium]
MCIHKKGILRVNNITFRVQRYYLGMSAGRDAYLAHFFIVEDRKRENYANWYFGISRSLAAHYQIESKSPDFRKTIEDFLFKEGTKWLRNKIRENPTSLSSYLEGEEIILDTANYHKDFPIIRNDGTVDLPDPLE